MVNRVWSGCESLKITLEVLVKRQIALTGVCAELDFEALSLFT